MPQNNITGPVVFSCFRLKLLNFFRITLALIFDQRVGKVETWLPACPLIVISGLLPVKLAPKKKFSKKFYCTKSFVLKFQGESLQLFLSYHSHFRRYRYLEAFGTTVPRLSATAVATVKWFMVVLDRAQIAAIFFLIEKTFFSGWEFLSENKNFIQKWLANNKGI